MKKYLPKITRLINIKAVKENVSLDTFTNSGDVGVFKQGSANSIDTGNSAASGDIVNIAYNINKKIYITPDIIIKNINSYEKFASSASDVIDQWTLKLDQKGDLSGSVLTINYFSDELQRRDGLTWSHSKVYTISKEDIDRYIVEKAFLETDITSNSGVNTVASDIISRELYRYIKNDENDIFDVTAYKSDGTTELTTLAAIDTEIATNKNVNKDNNAGNNKNIVLKFTAKQVKNTDYRDIEVWDKYPVGYKLQPSMNISRSLNGVTVNSVVPQGTGSQLDNNQVWKTNLSAGHNLRAMEWENMNYYSQTYGYQTLSDNTPSPELEYQFNNGTNYNIGTFNVFRPKSLGNANPEQLNDAYLLGSSVKATVNKVLAKLGLATI